MLPACWLLGLHSVIFSLSCDSYQLQDPSPLGGGDLRLTLPPLPPPGGGTSRHGILLMATPNFLYLGARNCQFNSRTVAAAPVC